MIPNFTNGIKVHEEIFLYNQNIRVRKAVTSSFHVLTGPKEETGRKPDNDVSQWADSHKNKEPKCLPIVSTP